MKTLYNNSAANQRVQQLAREHGDLLLPHLWTGITKVRPGAGIAVVGNPVQCADMLQQFIDAGCHSFCLSGYLHDEEAERFGRLIRPILAQHNRGRLAA
jgi:alkanesulfonate monooxygenase